MKLKKASEVIQTASAEGAGVGGHKNVKSVLLLWADFLIIPPIQITSCYGHTVVRTLRF